MKLSRILKAVKVNSIYRTGEGTAKKDGFKQNSNHDPDIKSVHYRAQDVQPGGLFVAIPGLAADGHDFIDEARMQGALAIISQKPVQPDNPVTQNGERIKNDLTIIEVDNSRKALAGISAAFFQNPSQKLNIIGITGTNGKTTITYLIESMLSAAGLKSGVIGTINYRYMGKIFENPVTTPESMDLQKILAEMLKKGVTHVVMEVSSHAIDLFRIENCWIDTGVFTNLTQDHLDYHGDMDSYWLCKKRMFTEYLSSGSKKDRALAVINRDNPKGRELFNILPVRGISTGHSEDNNIWPEIIKHDLNGIAGNISTPAGSFDFKSPLVGKHNIENILSAAGAGIALDLSLDNIKAGIENVFFIPGRLERIAGNNGRFVYVDYAHTPDALGNVLTSLKAVSDKKIICVFGCGGDRDREKRPLMGEIAGRLCDLAIVTSDNPRTEAPEKIIDQILPGLKKTCNHEYSLSSLETGFDKTGFAKKGYVIEPDRRSAIKLGITVSRQGDTVLIAGKGHETYQILGKKTISFDDRKEAKQALLTEAQRTKQHDAGNLKSEINNRMQWTTADILEATGGELIFSNQNYGFSGISIDSRCISSDELYVAIKGEVHDGHSFAEDVIRQGISGLVIDRNKVKDLPLHEWEKNKLICMAVNNTTKALGDLASFHRKRANVPVVAITGSNGKTTTREMTAAVVKQRFATLSSRGNFNNEIGLPLTLLKLDHGHKCAVVELGMNAPGEIARLGEICMPDIGVITNIGPAHLKGVGSIEGVMRAKGELLDKIKAGGTAVLNADDHRILHLAGKASTNVIFFGIADKAIIRAESFIETDRGISFALVLPEEIISIDLKTPGTFMVSNALAAAAVGYRLGLSAKEIKTGLEVFKPVDGRMNILHADLGINLIDDTYNANPGSMEAALKTLTALKKNNRGIFIIGDMFELGRHAKQMHEEIGALAAGSDISMLYATGEFAETVASGATGGGMKSENIFTGSKKDILNDLTGRLRTNDWVLVKGSRAMEMEEIVEGLMNIEYRTRNIEPQK